ncbi:MAG: choice-of-anchor Q domain-containing protein [Chloroflexota bacterium]
MVNRHLSQIVRQSLSIFILIAALIVSAAPQQHVHAASLTVCASGCGFTTISDAITAASAGDNIFIAAGLYNENVVISKNLNLIGTDPIGVAIQAVTIAGSPYLGTPPSTVTVNTGVTAGISGIVITGGGGNIYLPDAAAADALDNSGRRVGGGIDNEGTLVLGYSGVTNNVVTGASSNGASGGKYSPLGGGIYNAVGAALIISHSTISANAANGQFSGGGGLGGGVFNDNGSNLVITRSLVTANTAQGGGSLSNVSGIGGGGFGGDGGMGTGVAGDLGGFGGGSGSGASSSGTIAGGAGGTGGFAGGGGGGGRNQGGIGAGGGGGAGGFGGGGGGGGTSTGGINGNGGSGGFAGGNGQAGGGEVGSGGGAGLGGGIFNNKGSNVLISNSTITTNTAQGGNPGGNAGDGGGVGGGIFNNQGTGLTLSSSTITSNAAMAGTSGAGGRGVGGGIFTNGGSIALTNSILSNNSLAGGGPNTGINCTSGNGTGGSTAGGTFTSGGHNLIPDISNCTIMATTGDQFTVGTPPYVGALNNNGGPTQTQLPFANGGVVNTGSSCSSFDQRDVPRPQGAICDKGAVEFTTTTSAPTLTLPTGAITFTAGGGSVAIGTGAAAGDPDSSDFTAFTAAFTSTSPDAETLTIPNQGVGVGQVAKVTINGTTYLFYEGVIVGTLTGGTGGNPLVATFNANDSAAAVQAIAATTTYGNTTNPPTQCSRTVQFTLAGNGGSANASRSITLTGCTTSALRDYIGVFRPSTATFYLRNSNTTGSADITTALGVSTDLPVVGDWNGDGIDTVGIYRSSTGQFFLRDSNTAGAPIVYSFALGVNGDVPMAGDWDGDGKDGVGVFRPSNGLIYLKNSLTTGFANFQMVLGIPGDVPVAGDWNHDGKDSPGVYRPSSATFFLTDQVCNCNAIGSYQATLGIAGDSPIAGDWNNNGSAGIGVFRPSNGLIYLKNTPTTGFADIQIVFGIANDKPVAGHWFAGPPIPPQLAPTFVP